MSKTAYISNTGYRPRIIEAPAIKWTPKTVRVDHPDYGLHRMYRVSRDESVFDNRASALNHFRTAICAKIDSAHKRINKLQDALDAAESGQCQGENNV